MTFKDAKELSALVTAIAAHGGTKADEKKIGTGSLLGLEFRGSHEGVTSLHALLTSDPFNQASVHSSLQHPQATSQALDKFFIAEQHNRLA